jgi:hypothetical protein
MTGNPERPRRKAAEAAADAILLQSAYNADPDTYREAPDSLGTEPQVCGKPPAGNNSLTRLAEADHNVPPGGKLHIPVSRPAMHKWLAKTCMHTAAGASCRHQSG